MMKQRRKGNYHRIEATKVPEPIDIAWTAGIWEGEGGVSTTVSKKGPAVSLLVNVRQKDPWILYQLQKLFGGSVSNMILSSGTHTWNLTGQRAYDFLINISPYLSPKKTEYINFHMDRYQRNSLSKENITL